MTHQNRSKKAERHINGVVVSRTRIFQSSGFWRWKITDINGREYLDGGNYLDKDAASAGLTAVLTERNNI